MRIAAPVETLVVLCCAGDDGFQRGHPREHALGEVRVRARPLALRQGPGLRGIPHAARNTDHADVVDRPGSPEVRRLVRRQPHRRARLCGELGDAARVAEAERRLQVGEVAQRVEGRVELCGGQALAESRVERDHLIPRLERPDPVEEVVGALAESIDQIRIELRASAARGDLDGGFHPAAVMERFDVVGEVDESDGGCQFSLADTTGDALSVPALEGLDERSRHGLAEVEPTGEIAGRLAVRLHHSLHTSTGGGEELADHADPAQPRAAVAEMLGDEHRHRHRGEIVVVAVRVQVHLVAEQLGQFARIGRTSDPGQKRRVVGRRAHLGTDAGVVGEPHRDHRLAEHSLHRPTHPEVGHQRQRCHQLGEFHRFGRHSVQRSNPRDAPIAGRRGLARRRVLAQTGLTVGPAREEQLMVEPVVAAVIGGAPRREGVTPPRPLNE